MQLSDLDFSKVYSYADYLLWQLEERVELIKGKIFPMSPAPSTNHQIISAHLQYELYDFLEDSKGGCIVFSAPFDVRIPVTTPDDRAVFTVVQPDICVVCDRSKIDSKGCLGAPDLVVEILSPYGSKKELQDKYHLYQEAGVREYWLISPQDRTVLVYSLINGQYAPSRLMTDGDVVASGTIAGFKVDLQNMFERMI